MSERTLTDEQIETEIEHLNTAWSHIPGQGLVRVFETNSFAQGLMVVNEICRVVEDMGHYPEVTLRVDQVELVTTSQDAGGVTDMDVQLAKAIDAMVEY